MRNVPIVIQKGKKKFSWGIGLVKLIGFFTLRFQLFFHYSQLKQNIHAAPTRSQASTFRLVRTRRFFFIYTPAFI